MSLQADIGQDFGGSRGDGVKGVNWRCILKVEPVELSDGLDAQSEGSTVVSNQGQLCPLQGTFSNVWRCFGGASQVALMVENPACQCKRLKRHEFDPQIRKIPWRRAWQPTPVFLPEESSWTEEPDWGCSPSGHKESDTTKRLSTKTCRCFDVTLGRGCCWKPVGGGQGCC